MSTSTTTTLHCARCGTDAARMAFQPFNNDLGRRAFAEICQDCWSAWLKTQQQLINHYGLNVMDPQERKFLTQNMDITQYRNLSTIRGGEVATFPLASVKFTLKW